MIKRVLFLILIFCIITSLPSVSSSVVSLNSIVSELVVNANQKKSIQFSDDTTTEPTSDNTSSFGLLILMVLLLIGVSGGSYYLISEYKKEMSSFADHSNQLRKHIASKDIQLKKYEAAYKKKDAQKKEMKVIFANEYDKLVKKYKVLSESKSKVVVESKVESPELKEATRTLEETQALLIQSEKMSSLGQLTAGIAHEINNPVNFVSNGINTLKENFGQLNVFIDNYKKICELDTLEEIKKYYKIQREDDDDFMDLQTSTNESLDDVEYGTTRITEIVNGLRVFARQDELDIRQAEINQILENAIIILKPKYKKKAKILKDFDSNIAPIKCLPGQLNQALVNLIGNACDAIDFKGTISLKTTDFDDGTIKISIKDDGRGMSETTKKKIFDPFFTTKEVGKGTGLGLSITYGIIEKHNGKIEVESEEGKGTEFVITLPKKLRIVKKPVKPAIN